MPESETPKSKLHRRGFLSAAGGALAAGIAATAHAGPFGRRRTYRTAWPKAAVNGNINHSVCHWCFTSDSSCDPMTLEELFAFSRQIGIKSVELVDVEHWDLLKKYGLVCAMSNSHGFVRGFCNPENHSYCIDILKKQIDLNAEAGFPNVITFSGFEDGIPRDVGLENCIAGLKKVVGYAEKKKVNLIFELLNSRVDVPMKGHPGYMGDNVEWCVEMIKGVGSERLKLLFDVYHVQVMQGDVITRIKENKDYIGHYHTAGCPGRNEMDDTQELNYEAIMKVVAETGFDGYVGHEFIPTRTPRKSLWEAVRLCDA